MAKSAGRAKDRCRVAVAIIFFPLSMNTCLTPLSLQMLDAGGFKRDQGPADSLHASRTFETFPAAPGGGVMHEQIPTFTHKRYSRLSDC
ncbi:hypothetical protein BDK51DRAFT_42773 [Blyttiomyces helicus]|uniref:Uncharacterized protein n=1 Tax=Blyttiomyces helicus TaxID=388810 RepID=A0A4P9W7N2_9FUNG|nr:hypothetical protein BDK51DRAFT_42773 [Blyttiomyces helicus]|eukprot:RKO88102.1 hypothetical protein BDK51DRAFT_42773 [Blyttiomyces helicus]